MKYLEGIVEFCVVVDVGNFIGVVNKFDMLVVQISCKVVLFEKQLGVKLLQCIMCSVLFIEVGMQYFQQVMFVLKVFEDVQLVVSVL